MQEILDDEYEIEEEDIYSFQLTEHYNLCYLVWQRYWFIEGINPEDGSEIVDDGWYPMTEDYVTKDYTLTMDDFNKYQEIIVESMR